MGKSTAKSRLERQRAERQRQTDAKLAIGSRGIPLCPTCGKEMALLELNFVCLRGHDYMYPVFVKTRGIEEAYRAMQAARKAGLVIERGVRSNTKTEAIRELNRRHRKL